MAFGGGASTAGLRIEITADASKAASTLGRVGSAADKAGGQVEKSGSKFGSFARNAAKVAGAAALGGLVMMFKTGVGEQKDFLSGQAQLANGIKSTGNAANVSVNQLEDLASSIQGYSGQTDDSIVASEKLLLTFTNVGNKAGKNNDIFNQATKMTADMAAKMGGDASKYAVQLGKALNDPTKGITALTRVGVTFTAAQKKSIKTMQDSGNTLGAQKVIMGELRKEFGGSAKAAGQTLPGQMEIAKRSFEDVSQSLVASLMPAFTALMNIVMKDLLPAFKALFGFITDNMSWLGPLAIGIGVLVVAFKAWKLATAEATIANIALARSMLTNPIFLVIAAIAALAIGLVVLYKKSATFRAIVQGAFKGVAAAGHALWTGLKAAFDAIKKVIQGVSDWLMHSKIAAVLLGPWRIAFGALNALVHGGISGVLGYFRGLLTALGSALVGVASAIYKPFKTAWGWIATWVVGPVKRAFTGTAAAVTRALAGVASAIYKPFKTAWGWISKYVVAPVKRAFTGTAAAASRALAGVSSAIYKPFKTAWSWISRYVVSPVKRAFSGTATAVRNALSGVSSAIYTPFKNAWTWIKTWVIGPVKSAFSGTAGAISRALSGVEGAITAPFKAAWDWIKRYVLGPVKSAWNTVANGINAIHVSFTVPSNVVTKALHLAGKGFTFDPPNIPTLAKGGYVDQATLAIIGEGRGGEIVAPDDMLRRIIREEMANRPGITINGALDPVAVARQLKAILRADDRRTSGVRRSGVTVTA